MGCMGNCDSEVEPPPDMILSMPPPPLPSFLLPRSAIVALAGNETHPCFAAYMCGPYPRLKEYGIEFIDLSGKGHITFENTWIFILLGSGIGIILIGVILILVYKKYRDNNNSHRDNNVKQSTMPALGGVASSSTKANPFMSGGMLYPCPSNRDSIQQQLATESRLLWATLTPHGTRSFVTSFPNSQDGHYEIVDYKLNRIHYQHQHNHHQQQQQQQQQRQHQQQQQQQYVKHHQQENVKRTPVKSFDNSGFIDYDYEDPTLVLDPNYHDDLDSGYQEPHEVTGSLTRNSSPLRPIVSSPTRIENPNIPPLNIYPHHKTLDSSTLTLNKKSNLIRRISDASSYSATNT